MDITLHMGAFLERDILAAYGAVHASVHDDVLGHYGPSDLPYIANDERSAVDITLDLTLDLHVTL